LVTQLLGNKNLYAADASDEIKEDLLRRLLRHQFGISDAIQPDAMPDRFTSPRTAASRVPTLGMTMSFMAVRATILFWARPTTMFPSLASAS
jgi:hypothetical protein